ncbi:hypothetical protein SS50377_22054 [Spironucleus salmonicida]|uniref:Cysteine-rich protein n=1 Tax=Spironucleus salmonicida TaxID=348837 RepID=A0A9P8LY77_9EUKA|nr:hypothetical protein SS50377_22054 [Spironucleus salmonicida]
MENIQELALFCEECGINKVPITGKMFCLSNDKCIYCDDQQACIEISQSLNLTCASCLYIMKSPSDQKHCVDNQFYKNYALQNAICPNPYAPTSIKVKLLTLKLQNVQLMNSVLNFHYFVFYVPIKILKKCYWESVIQQEI